MALVLTLKQGEDFFLGSKRMVVHHIVSENEFILLRDEDQAVITVNNSKSVEIYKGVFVSVGARGQAGLARVAIEAPRSVVIARGSNYRRSSPAPSGRNHVGT